MLFFRRPLIFCCTVSMGCVTQHLRCEIAINIIDEHIECMYQYQVKGEAQIFELSLTLL